MATVRLNGASRTELGKQGAKHARAEGRIPAILYGEKLANVSLSVDAHDLRTALSTRSGRNVIIQLSVDGAEAERTVIRGMPRDPITRTVLHVDFQRISENKPVTMQIPVVLVGECLAVKEGRGILDHTMRELEVRCLPRHIPEHIEVDVSHLEVKSAVHVGEISVPDIEILDNKERPVVEVLQPTLFQEPTTAAAAPAEGEAAEGEAAEGEEGAAPAAAEEPKKGKKEEKAKG